MINFTFLKKALTNKPTLVIQPIRYNWHYVVWYRNVIVTTISLVIPLTCLAYWNFNTLTIMRRRRLASHPQVALLPNDTHSQGKSPQIDATNVLPASHNVTISVDSNVPHILARSNSVSAKSKLALPLVTIF